MDLFHVLNRGVEKRIIFLDDSDRLRFMHDLFAFNDTDRVPNYAQPGRKIEHSRDVLVHIHAYCLMPNHYHLLLSPVVENGIPLFIKKLNGGYAKYFNERYTRSGTLWQGKYKRILVERDAHLLYIPYYIHLNPLDLSHPQWRTGGVHNPASAIKALNEYRWSSHLDYDGKKNFPSILYTDLLRETVGTPKQYEKELRYVLSSPRITAESELIEV